MEPKPVFFIKRILAVTSGILLQNKPSIEDLNQHGKAGNILVISLTHLGDMVLLSPFLYNLRRNFPDARVDILIKKQVDEIFEYCPYINNRIIYNAKWVTSKKSGAGLIKTLMLICRLKKNHYDLTFVTHPHIFSNMIACLAGIPFRVGYSDAGDGFLNMRFEKVKRIQHARNYPLDLLRYLALKVESEELNLCLGQAEIAFAEEVRKSLSLSGASFLIGVHPGSGKRTKIWLVEGYAEVMQYLINKHNAHILLFAGKQEADITEKIQLLLKNYQHKISDFTGKLTILQMAALMGLCKVILTNDSGPMHVAAASGKPVVALFIASAGNNIETWGPLSNESKVVSGANGKICRPEDIKAEDVIKAVDDVISKVIVNG